MISQKRKEHDLKNVSQDSHDNSEMKNEVIEEEPEVINDPQKKPRLDAGEKLEARRQQKQLRIERKSKLPNFDLISEIKKKWEILRQTDLDAETRKALVLEMMQAVKGHIVEIVFKHDASRVIQSLLKHGTSNDRDLICKELQGKHVEMSKSPYGRFLLHRVLKYCPAHRNSIIGEFFSHVPQLVRHLIASYTIEKIYTQYASNKVRYQMLQELYHPEFRKFKTTDSLEMIVTTRDKAAVIESLLSSIKPALNKGILGDLTILQQAVLDFLSIADDAAKHELLTSVHPLAILHTREGSRLATKAIALADARDRKKILRELRSFIHKIASEEFGHIVLMEAMDTVDDTVLIGSTIGREFVEDPSKLDALLKASRYARNVALFAVVGRSSRMFPTTQLDLLTVNGKKNPCMRYQEIRSNFADALHNSAMRNLGTWLADSELGPFCVELLVRAAVGLDAALAGGELGVQLHKITLEACANCDRTTLRMIKRLLQYERSWVSANKKAKIAEGYNEQGRKELLEEISAICKAITIHVFEKFSQDDLLRLATSDGAFVAVAFCEDPNTSFESCKILSKNKKDIEKSSFPGTNILKDILSKSK